LEEEQVVFSLKQMAQWIRHYHHQGVLQLREKRLTVDVSKLEDQISNCKGCQFGKQNKNIFSKDNMKSINKVVINSYRCCIASNNTFIKGKQFKASEDIQERDDDGV